MKHSPFPTLAEFLRAMLKALVLVLLINAALLAAQINPVRALVTLNTWDVLGRGRARLAYPSDFQNGQLPLEALLAAHEISRGAKPPDEYRIILLGESGIAGWGVDDQDTLAAQLTDLGIEINDRRVVAYNLAYPQPSVARDVLILDATLAYNPDLVIWFMTPAALENSGEVAGANRVFFNINRERLQRVTARHGDLTEAWYAEQVPALLDEPDPTIHLIAIQNQDLLPVWLNSLFYPFIEPDLARSERRIGLEPVPAEARFTTESPGFQTMPNDTWRWLDAGCREAVSDGTNLLIVNEPMVIGSGPHSDENYNVSYQRTLYDRYRDVLRAYTDDHGLWYADLWDVIPPEHFTDTPLHADAEGYAILSAALSEVLARENMVSTCE